MEIVPAIDIIGGQCVRLEKGNYDTKKVYHEDPVEVAKGFEANGLKRVHVVDLDGAKASRVINHHVVERIAAETSLAIDFGGGIKSIDDLKTIFRCGALQVTVGSIAAEKPELFFDWLAIFGPKKIILGADLRNGYIATRGWLEATDLHWKKFLKEYIEKGVEEIICTDISKDGMMQGPALELYSLILKEFPDLKLTASGGVSSMDDVRALKDINCHACIIGKAIYEGNIKPSELKRLA